MLIFFLRKNDKIALRAICVAYQRWITVTSENKNPGSNAEILNKIYKYLLIFLKKFEKTYLYA